MRLLLHRKPSTPAPMRAHAHAHLQPALCVTHGSSRVVVQGAKVAMTSNLGRGEGSAHAAFIPQLLERVV